MLGVRASFFIYRYIVPPAISQATKKYVHHSRLIAHTTIHTAIPVIARFLLVDFNPFIPNISPSIAHIMATSMPSKNIHADPERIPVPCQTHIIHGSIILITPNIREYVAL